MSFAGPLGPQPQAGGLPMQPQQPQAFGMMAGGGGRPTGYSMSLPPGGKQPVQMQGQMQGHMGGQMGMQQQAPGFGGGFGAGGQMQMPAGSDPSLGAMQMAGLPMTPSPLPAAPAHEQPPVAIPGQVPPCPASGPAEGLPYQPAPVVAPIMAASAAQPPVEGATAGLRLFLCFLLVSDFCLCLCCRRALSVVQSAERSQRDFL